MLVVTIIAAMLVLLLALTYQLSWYDPRVPCVFEIINVRHTNTGGIMTDDGYVTVKNSDTLAYENWNLYAKTYVNGNLIVADLPTLNTDEWIHIVGRRGVHTLGGSGASGTRAGHDAYWYSGSSLAIDYNDHLIRPGDCVTIEVYNKSSGQILSRDTFPHTNEKVREMMDRYFSLRGA